jgi:hypothetical protein
MIPYRGFEPRKAQAEATQAGILVMGIPEVATPTEATPAAVIPGVAARAAVILGAATRVGAVGEVIPQGDNRTPARTFKRTPRCIR